MFTLQTPTADDYPELLEIWEHSVRATHHFLKDNEVMRLKSIIQEQNLFAGPSLLCAVDKSGSIAGFIGTSGSELDMLFIAPGYMNKGAGKMLTLYAIQNLGVRKVDVNEENEQARGFYEHLGFRTVSRSEVDALGLPYPLLHMELAASVP